MNYSENCTFGTLKGQCLNTGGLYAQMVFRTGSTADTVKDYANLAVYLGVRNRDFLLHVYYNVREKFSSYARPTLILFANFSTVCKTNRKQKRRVIH